MKTLNKTQDIRACHYKISKEYCCVRSVDSYLAKQSIVFKRVKAGGKPPKKNRKSVVGD